MLGSRGTPCVVHCGENGDILEVSALTRLPLTGGHDEVWLQQVLFDAPELLPIDELDERVQGDLIPIGMEEGIPVGICDNLYISTDGYVVVVETKLWCNPEARRVAVAQILDYATDIRSWDYAKLESVWQKHRSAGAVTLWQGVKPEEEEHEWIDRVSRNLRAGRMTLIIAGDGIREEAWDLAETVSGHPDFEFRLGMVEIRLYQIDDNSVLAIPFVQLQTQEVTRAIVRIEGEHSLPEGVSVRVQTPPDKAQGRKSAPDDLTMAEFWEKVAGDIGTRRSEELQKQVGRLLAELDSVGVKSKVEGQSLRFTDPVGENPVQIGMLYSDGNFVCNVPKGSLKGAIKERKIVDQLQHRFETLRTKIDGIVQRDVDPKILLSADNYPKVLKWLTCVTGILSEVEQQGDDE